MNSQEEKRTLSNADITSRRATTRRSFLGTLGIGLGVGAAALVVGVATPADAQKGKKRHRMGPVIFPQLPPGQKDWDPGNWDRIIVHPRPRRQVR